MTQARAFFSILGGVVLIAGGLLWLGIAYRALSLPFLTAAILMTLFTSVRPSRHRFKITAAAWAIFVLATLSPVDISAKASPQGPHLARVVVGMVGARGIEEARRGDVVLTGCMVTGFEPRWMFLWRKRSSTEVNAEISRHHLTVLGYAITEYSQDHGYRLPPTSTLSQFRGAIHSYLHEDWYVTDPQTQRPYAVRTPRTDSDVMVYEDHPSSDGHRRYVTADGQLHTVSESEWPQIL